jgi:DNA-directed RNA polymerase alpha subunit
MLICNKGDQTMHNEENKDLIFSDIYPIVVSADNDVSVMDLPFSVRLKNVLMRNHVATLSAILATNVAEFEGFRNLGTKSVKELNDYLNSLMEEGVFVKPTSSSI